MRYLDLAAGVTLFIISTMIYLSFLGEMGYSSYYPFMSLFFNQSEQISASYSDAKAEVIESHIEYFSERLELPAAKIGNPLTAGYSWVLEGELSCDLLGTLQAMKKVIIIDNRTELTVFPSTENARNELKHTAGSVMELLNFTPSHQYLQNLSVALAEDYMNAIEANVTMNSYCIAEKMTEELKEFSEQESIRAAVDIVEKRNDQALIRAFVLRELKEEVLA